LTRLSKAGQPDYKPADRFINRSGLQSVRNIHMHNYYG